MSIPAGWQFAKALEEAGVISGLDRITRVVIDIQPGDAARVYVERIGDKRLLGLFKGQLGHMLAENALKPEPEQVPVHAADCALMLPHAAADCRPAEGPVT